LPQPHAKHCLGNGGSGGTLNTDGYTYDPAGNRLTSNSYDGYTAYTYDAADQITGENHNAGYPSFTATYDYDHNGNRLHKTQNGQTDMYTYQANAYNSALHTDELQKVSGGLTGTKTYGYDTNGVANKITTNGTPLYLTADAEDRYTRFDFNTGPGTGSVYSTETYNGAGLRTFRHSADGLNHSLAYGGTSPGDALLSDSNASTLYTPGLVQQDTNGQHFFQTDALGSVRGFTGNNQAPQGEVYYDAFGLPSVRQGSQPTPLGFAGAAGYQTDADTGLMLLGNRYYDPSVGRFLSPDPSGSGDNWYAYCDNAPLNHTDPTGLMGVPTPTGANFGNPIGQANSAVGAINELGGWGVAVQKDRDRRNAEKAARLMAEKSAARATNVSYATFRWWAAGHVRNNLDSPWPVVFDARDGQKYLLGMPAYTHSTPLTDIDFLYLGGLLWVHLMPVFTATVDKTSFGVRINYADPDVWDLLHKVEPHYSYGYEPIQQPGMLLPIMSPATAFDLGYIAHN